MPSAADDAAMTDTATVIDQYNAAFLERAPEKLVDLIADDCVMEGTGPAPDGNRWTGYDECLAGWQGLASDPATSSRSSTPTSTVTAPSSAGGSLAPRTTGA
jgi:hypothetical protein